jgi:uroporphyrinogen-III decarboxylase
MSDGKVDDVVDDIFACGADGMMGEPYTNLESVTQRYPDKILLGNIDNRILSTGDKDAIYAEVERCARFGLDTPGYFFSVSNHIPYNIPVDAVRHYFDACDKYSRR